VIHVWRTIRHLNFKMLWTLLRLSLRNIPFLIPTMIATKKCMQMATVHFGKQHQYNGPENAFRHALWVYFIIYFSKPWTNKAKKAVVWAEKITSLHEEIYPNTPLEKAMDLHNNKMGEKLFRRHGILPLEDIVVLIKSHLKDAVLVNSIAQIAKIQMRLVYIE